MENGRTVTREKYSELKLEAQFLRVSPGYLTATPGLTWLGGFGAPYSIAITGLAANQTISNGTGGWYLVYRHADPTSMQSTTFRLTIPTYVGLVTVPRLRGRLVLNGRDSKFLVINYPVGNTTILYSTAEIFTWKQFEDRKVLVVYGGPSETHELAILSPFRGKTIEGSGITIITHLNTTTINFDTSPVRRVVQVGDLWIHLVGGCCSLAT